ncbi:MAG: hypothetical protein JNL38_21110 [Myxococcales bacterium]|nr:hypothetical protein [Myxococcales bacterium]
MPRRLLNLKSLCAALALAARADDEPTTEQAAAADHLFSEGLALMRARDFEAACPKLEKSLALDPGTGTKLNLALCYEALGRTASAWTLFNAVASEARRATPPRADRVKTATEHAAALQPSLSYLTVKLSSPAPGATISVDGAAWVAGEEVPIDPGSRRIEVSAPGHERAASSVVVQAGGARVVVEVPPLTKTPPAAPAPAPAPLPLPVAPAPTAREESGMRRPLGLGLAGTGVVSAGVGAVFGALALGQNEASKRCGADPACTRDEGYPKANTYAWVANVTIPVGVVLTAIGAYLVLTSGRAPEPRRAAMGPGGVSW